MKLSKFQPRFLLAALSVFALLALFQLFPKGSPGESPLESAGASFEVRTEPPGADSAPSSAQEDRSADLSEKPPLSKSAEGEVALGALLGRVESLRDDQRPPFLVRVEPEILQLESVEREFWSSNAQRVLETDKNGEFSFEKLDAGKYRLFVLPLPEQIPADLPESLIPFYAQPQGKVFAIETLGVEAGKTKEIVIVIPARSSRARIVGFIVGLKPELHYSVTGDYRQSRGEVSMERSLDRQEAQVGKDGFFSLDDLNPGSWDLEISAWLPDQKSSRTILEVRDFFLESGEEKFQQIAISPHQRVKIAVRDIRTSRPVSKAVMTYFFPQGSVEGMMNLDSRRNPADVIFQEGSYHFLVVANGYAVSYKEILIDGVGDREILFNLEPMQAWETVLIGPNGTPLASSIIYFRSLEGKSIPEPLQPSAKTDEAGRLRIVFLEKGAYSVAVQGPEGKVWEGRLALERSSKSGIVASEER